MRSFATIFGVWLVLATWTDSAKAEMTVIHSVAVVDVEGGTIARDRTVILNGQTITSVRSTAGVAFPLGARVVDGRGRFLIPGLWDMASFALSTGNEVPGSMELLVAHGVVGIRNLVTDYPPARIKAMVSDIAEGRAVGPKFIWSSRALSRTQHTPVPLSSTVDVRSEADLVTAINATAADGAHFVFVRPGLPEKYLSLAVQTAQRYKLPVSGWFIHGWKPAVEAGVSDIYHFVDLYRSTASKPDRDIYLRLGRDPEFRRSTAPDRDTMYAFMEPLRSKRDRPYYRATIAAVARTRTPVVTNMATMFWAQQGNKALIDSRTVFAKPRKTPLTPPPPTAIEDNSRDGLWSDLLDLHAAGVVLMTGTSSYGQAEAVPGPTLHDELEILVQAGFSPRQALQMATVNPGRVAQRLYPSVRVATGIKAGQPADLVLLDQNPLTNIKAVRAVHGVVANGRYFGPEEIAALLKKAREIARASP